MDQNAVWPGWKIIRPIGRGGFGEVYEIHRDVLGETEKAALKIISIPQSPDEIDNLRAEGYNENSIIQRFNTFAEEIVREYAMMARMKGNANIVYCDDYQIVQQDNGVGRDVYIRMELLTPLLKAMDQVSYESQIVRFGMEMCNALDACQKQKIIHRDIKPQNIFVSNDGTFKLGDFGIARKAERTTQATVGTGTYQFMAPEVRNELPYGPTVDIYSLGLVMYWLLNECRCPFYPLPPAVPTHREAQEAIRRRFSGEKIPEPKNGSKELKAIVLKACAFDTKERYQSARAMGEDLMRISGGRVAGISPIAGRVPIPKKIQDEKTKGTVYNISKEKLTPVAPIAEEKKQQKEKRKVWPFTAAIIALLCIVLTMTIVVKPTSVPEETKPKIEATTTQCAESEHHWIEATCTMPRKCAVCDAVEGLPADHIWNISEGSSQYVCALCGITEKTIAIHYKVNFPANVVEKVDSVPTIGGTISDVVTDYVMAENVVDVRTLTERIARAEIITSSIQSRSYYFKGWTVEGTGLLIQPDTQLAWSELEIHADEKDNVYFTGIWEDATRYNSVSFFVRFDSKAIDTNGNIASQPATNYSPEVFYTHVGGVNTALTNAEIKKAYEIADAMADNSITADQAIRALRGEKSEGIWLYSFPTDEDVFMALRTYLTNNPDKQLTVEGEDVDLEKLNSNHFAIRWYVFKLEDVAWHIDGKLITK